jgi:hypothetical protein
MSKASLYLVSSVAWLLGGLDLFRLRLQTRKTMTTIWSQSHKTLTSSSMSFGKISYTVTFLAWCVLLLQPQTVDLAAKGISGKKCWGSVF